MRKPRTITLVMGLQGSGKSFLLTLLSGNTFAVEDTRFYHTVSLAGLKHAKDEIEKAKNIVLDSSMGYNSYMRKQLIEVAKFLADEGKFVYIHCYPRDYKWLKEVFA